MTNYNQNKIENGQITTLKLRNGKDFPGRS